MLQTNTTKRLGYWLLHLHHLFDSTTGAALADRRLTRRHWQVLHAVAIGVDDTAAIDAAFAPFLRADGIASFCDIVDDLHGRGFIIDGGGRLTLSEEGRREHEVAEQLVNAHAAEQLRGITEAEFLAANDVLARIAANIENGGKGGVRS